MSKHIGSSFDTFLSEEGIKEEVDKELASRLNEIKQPLVKSCHSSGLSVPVDKTLKLTPVMQGKEIIGWNFVSWFNKPRI